MTQTTKKYKNLSITFTILSILSTLLPLIIYIIIAFSKAELTAQKVGLTCTIIIAIILTATNILFKYHIRSTIWILFIGIYICLKDVLSFIIIIAICTILDEFIFTPCKKKFKEKYSINSEIDKRS